MVSTAVSISSVEYNDEKDVDTFIDNLILKHSENAEMMNLMALEATSLATSVSSRSKELEGQNILQRLWRNFSGSNSKIAARNDRDLAQSQYLGQQMLNKLAENNLMTYQMVVALGDKVNRVVADIQDTRNEILELNQTLATFFSSVRETLETKLDSLERNDDLIFWKETLDFETVYKGMTYRQLSRPEKIICLANEFFRHSQQKWVSRDLSFLKTVIVSIGNHPDEKVKLSEIYSSYQTDSGLLSQLLKGVSGQPILSETNLTTPTLFAFDKLQLLESCESYVVDTVLQCAPGSEKDEVALKLTTSFLKQEVGRDFEHEISMFDAVMNFTEDLVFYHQYKNKFTDDNVILEKQEPQSNTLVLDLILALGGAGNINEVDLGDGHLYVDVLKRKNVDKNKFSQLGVMNVMECSNQFALKFNKDISYLKSEINSLIKGSIEIVIPDYIGKAIVTEILVAAGDSIKKGQSLIAIEIDKTSLELPSSQSGIVKVIKVDEGDSVSTGSLIMYLV